jgi:proteasome component ECM29
MTPRQASTTADSDDNSLVYPGLSVQAVLDVTNNHKVTWGANQLTEAKVSTGSLKNEIPPTDALLLIQLGIIHFVLSNVFTDNERLLLLLAGACDANHLVVSACEDGLRRWTNTVDLENKTLILSLYTLYLGTKPTTRRGKRIFTLHTIVLN